jgi:hypothetical protein
MAVGEGVVGRQNSSGGGRKRVKSGSDPMQLLTGAEEDGNVISRVKTTLSLHRSTGLGRC